MRSLIRRADDRGAVGVLVGILLGGGVLLGMGALVVDTGQLYQERAELQNGADAGALAVAHGCATGSSTCSAGKANSLVNANAKDGASSVALVCGYDGSGKLPGCPTSSGAMVDCPAAPSSGTKYVDVHTSTLTAGGSTLLPPAFSRALAGNSGYTGSTVHACGRAAWGPPSAATTVAMTISYCEWQTATSGGTSYAPPPPATPPASYDRVLKLHTTGAPSCASGPAGSDGPGMFGWVDDTDSDCSAFISGGTYSADTGASAGKQCQTLLANAQTNHTVIYVPVYTSVTGTGTGGTYTLKGFAAFVVTGYHLPSFSASDWLKKANDCKGSDKCVNGYFTQGLIPSSGVIGGPNLGASIVQLTG